RKRPNVELSNIDNKENVEPVTNMKNIARAKAISEAAKSASQSQQIEKYSNTSTEDNVKKEEVQGVIEFHVVRNSLTEPFEEHTSFTLLSLQSMFAYQLLQKSREFISQAVFNPEHKTLSLIKNNKPIGGICFRQFPSQNFIEIMLCAVTTHEQLQGYGSRMINHLKDYIIQLGIRNVLIYAEDKTVEYFSKHGFSKSIKLERSVYETYIKEFDGATLMHCELHPDIVYTQFSSVVRNQQKILQNLVTQKQKDFQCIRKGLTCFRQGVESIPIAAIPGLQTIDLQSQFNSQSLDDHVEPEYLLPKFETVLQSIRQHCLAWPFLLPVNAEEVPDYYDRIKYPMDLRTVGERLTRGYYKTRRLFKADMARIFSNCRLYNAPDTIYFRCANSLERYFQNQMRKEGLCDE
ncbi:hypothetical protein KR222_006382, partial [Zaprionus bogoriensis]